MEPVKPPSRLPARMTQKATLKPYLEEIRQWVEQGRTDVWIAHTLNSTPASISAFRSSHGILRRDVASEARAASPPVIPPDAPPEESPTKRRRRTKKSVGAPPLSAPTTTDKAAAAVAVRLGRRRGRAAPASAAAAAGAAASALPGTRRCSTHGEEGYGFWLDGAVRDDPVFAEHWAGVRALSVRIEADQIVIRADDRG